MNLRVSWKFKCLLYMSCLFFAATGKAASGENAANAAAPQQEQKEEAAPLQFRLGSAYFTPIGFMDFTSVFRDTDPGSNIGTNFGSIPYRTPSNVAGNLSEFRMSPQNSRLGMRVDAKVNGYKVLGY
jgi:hypothetical protein